MKKETYAQFKQEGKDRRDARREKVNKAIVAAGSPITVLSQVATGEFHATERPLRGRADRRAVGLHKPRHRNAKRIYAGRGADHREVVALHRDLHEAAQAYRRIIRQAAKLVGPPA